MGIYDRDYERSYDTGSGWRDGGYGGGGFPGAGGMNQWSANSKLLVTLLAVYVAQVLFKPTVDDLFALPSNWFTQPWRVYGLFSYSLLHSTESLNHLLFNGLAIFFFGRSIEQKYGSREYLAFFFAAAGFAGLAWSLSELLDGRPGGGLLVGASGGIAGIILLFALNYPHVRVYIMGVLPVPAWLMAAVFLVQDVLGALGRSGNVAFTAHLGGALFGYLYFRNRWRVTDWLPGEGFKLPSLKRRPNLKIHTVDDEPATPADDQLDEVLAKIQREGQDSLTSAERRILDKASRRYQQKRR